jgi:hypothetical protein
VTKADIGEIRIQDRDTVFEVAPGAAEAFAEAVRRPDTVDPNIRFAPATDGPPTHGSSAEGSSAEGPPKTLRYDKKRPFRKPEHGAAPAPKPRKAGDQPLKRKTPGGPKKSKSR